MIRSLKDWKVLVGLLLAYLLISISFDYKQQVFWYLYTATMLVLISITIMNEKIEDKTANTKHMLIGVISGIGLYLIVAAGNLIFGILPGNFDKIVATLYDRFSPEWFWQYLALIFIIAPGEELFWRGFIQKRFMNNMGTFSSIFASAALYAGAFIFTDYPILIIMAFVSGIFWGLLYVWKRSIPLLIVSHLLFDLLLLIFFPLS
ncbi:CPBP family intramembrane glutamic endopeptidase [Bacillus niameyensis]|uniref:CPBP family intramembrane glutamic endopeptidase n=1 Tax=Bacillus niameyensis TaxID=1522308 RepID=UPI0007856928|nr:CPBP family intramembrane glutamic endopeptidase [Bacillus niameyensis]